MELGLDKIIDKNLHFAENGYYLIDINSKPTIFLKSLKEG